MRNAQRLVVLVVFGRLCVLVYCAFSVCQLLLYMFACFLRTVVDFRIVLHGVGVSLHSCTWVLRSFAYDCMVLAYF